MPVRTVDGGCEAGYAATSCLWGVEPEPLLAELLARYPVAGRRVYDAGCGEGRNAVHLARHGALVTAVDVSRRALAHAAATWPDEPRVRWLRADLVTRPPAASYHVVVCDSVLHWLAGSDEAELVVRALQAATAPGGCHLVCAFNDRAQELAGHDHPPRYLLRHADLLALYRRWRLLVVRDEDLISAHPGAPRPHRHSVTKILAQAPDPGTGGEQP